MKELVVIENEQVVTTSLQVAEVFNKQHKHVLEAIDDLIGVVENSADLFYEDTYIHPQNKQEYRQILMNKKGWILIAMGFTGKKAAQFKLDYINAFDEMEKMLKDSQPKLPTDPMEILQLTFDAQKQTNERVEVLEEDVKEIKENQLISTEDKNSLDRMIRRKVAIICKEQHLEQKAKSLLFSDIGKSIKELFGVPHRGRIKDKDFQAAVDFVNTWEPSSLTKTRINQLRLEL
ncbi:Rha family transcriptional regulator (plasmid) [Vagococcus lutrae]|uniref:Rha family transcriptional regulator n=1 Tax=Vagococcus lutrae TaxID=81947 RepID=A0AAE9XGF1_9ENTE|nr:Rha family transcriptional regulator [Vagococcus lutrae]WCG23702.1 Rha family transcriptional regulator [Vagococcus lutrae]